MENRVTFVLTSCGRNDLLERTLDTFFKWNTYPIERYIITEDSADPNVFQECERLNLQKYNGKLEFIFNHEKLGQSASIDKAYSMVETEYIFHCEEDWEFYNGGFIEDSIKVLKTQPKVIQAWIRPKSDKILNQIENKVLNLQIGASVRRVLPASFIVKGANEDGTDMVIKDYMGFSWNPGLKRLKDWQELPNGYSGFEREHLVDQYYRDKGFMVVSLSTNDQEGYVRHSGWGRRSADPVYRKEIGISVIMPSYLGEYPGSRSNPKEKFIRAVESFRLQDHSKKELIIVSDGCEITNSIYFERWLNDKNISLIRVEKQKGWPGKLRESARSFATNDWICYLDSDDMLKNTYLKEISNFIIKNKIQKNQVLTTYKYLFPIKDGNVLDIHSKIIGYDIDTIKNHLSELYRCVEPYDDIKYSTVTPILNQLNSTWQIVHHNDCTPRWNSVISKKGGEDKQFINSMFSMYEEVKSNHVGYIVCHHADRSLDNAKNLMDF